MAASACEPASRYGIAVASGHRFLRDGRAASMFRSIEDFSPAGRREAAKGGGDAGRGSRTGRAADRGCSSLAGAGISLHEAVGHGWRRTSSAPGIHRVRRHSGPEKVASRALSRESTTGTGGRGPGLAHVDDEGQPGRAQGIDSSRGSLKGYRYDHLNAKLTGQRSPGFSGRSQSFRYSADAANDQTLMAPGDQRRG